MAFGMVVTEDDNNKNEDFERNLEIIFEERARDMRTFNILIILVNLFNQVSNLPKISGANQITIQSIYWLCWILGTGLTYRSTKPGCLMLVKYANIALTTRNILRLYNFEESENDGVNLAQ